MFRSTYFQVSNDSEYNLFFNCCSAWYTKTSAFLNLASFCNEICYGFLIKYNYFEYLVWFGTIRIYVPLTMWTHIFIKMLYFCLSMHVVPSTE
jgi:hypothetical protein